MSTVCFLYIINTNSGGSHSIIQQDLKPRSAALSYISNKVFSELCDFSLLLIPNRRVSAAALDQPMYWKGLHKACAHVRADTHSHTHTAAFRAVLQAAHYAAPSKKESGLKSGHSLQPHLS